MPDSNSVGALPKPFLEQSFSDNVPGVSELNAFLHELLMNSNETFEDVSSFVI